MRAVILVLFLLTAWPAAAGVEPDEMLADPLFEARARALSQEIRCLVCQSESIDTSNADLARDVRVLVGERIKAGDSDQEVLDYLVARYGDFVLKPKTALLWFRPFDEAYNAGPALARAALNLLGTLPAAFGGRRIAVLGDIHELGAGAPQLHRDLAPDLAAAKVDLAFLFGPQMQSLYDLLPDAMKGAHRATSDGMVQRLIAALNAGDIVLIKGSLGTRMAPLVEAVRSLDSSAGQKPGDGH